MKKIRSGIKEKIEEYHLDIFYKLHSLPGRKLPRKINQSPDFLFSCDEEIIGIEHTLLKQSIKFAELKGTQRKIVERAKQMAVNNKLPPLKVTVVFHDYFNRYRKKVNQIADALFETINTKLPTILEIENGHTIQIDPPETFVGMTSILINPGTLNGVRWLNEHDWRIDEVGFVSRYFTNEIQLSIDKKNKKINQYLKYCDTCWLLIVADRYKADQKFEFSEEMKNHNFRSKFSKTFYMEIAERCLIQLKVY